MPDLAIIADDLTGALDAAAPFAARGLHTRVALHPGALPEALAAAPRIVAVSTDSREIPPDRAREAVREAVRALPKGTALFKKVDSRLKGNVAAELDAIDYRRALVAPAIPAFDRRTRNGHIEGFGVVRPIDVRDRLGLHAARAQVPDVAQDDDFERALDGPFDLPVGARGLAEAIARRHAPSVVPDAPVWAGRRAYCVIGSTDPITLAQVERLRADRPDLVYLPAPNGVSDMAAEATPLTLVQAVPGRERASPDAVSRALGETLARLSPEPGSLLVLSGGACAQAILRRLGIATLRLLGEALPGAPVAAADGLTVVTKSGGFGGPETLSRILAAPNPLEPRGNAHVG